MKVILDTNFIISCINERTDFMEAENFGSLILAKQVSEELKKISEKGNRKDKEAAKLAIKIIEKNKKKFEIVDLEVHFVDLGIENYVKNNKNLYVATLDNGLKRRLKNKARLLTLRKRKKIEEV